MTKITLAPITNPQNLTSLQTQINANQSIVQTAFDNTLSRDGTLPNQMLNNLDMNSNQILNLPAPAGPNSPARLVDVNSTVAINVPPTGTSGAVMGLLNTNNTYSGNDTFSGANTFTGASNTFTNITLPANSVSSSNITSGAVGSSAIATNAVANTNLAQMPANTIKGNNTGSTANAADLTAAQVTTMLGVWGNSTSTKLSAYTVVNADAGTTIVLGGGSFFTLTLNAAGTYSSNFVVKIVNNDTRGKRISPSGLTSFILWPGQNMFIFNAGGIWVVESVGRYQKGGLQFFVDTTNGNDSNDGLAGGAGAFKTITAAYTTLVSQIDCQNSTPTINIAAGTYTESLVLQGQLTGFNYVLFSGAGSNSVTWKPSTSACMIIGDNAECQVSGIKFDNTSGPSNAVGISMHQYGIIDVLNDIQFGTFPGTASAHINNDKGGFVNLPASYTIVGSAAYHIQMSSTAVVTQSSGGTISIQNTPTFTTFYFFVLGSMLNFTGVVTYSGSVATGAKQYSLDYLSCFVSSGSTLTNIGSVAGTVGHNSIFV